MKALSLHTARAKCRQVALLLACALGWMGAAAVQAAVPSTTAPEAVLRDDRGHVVATAHAPQRIVSLLPSLTEAVCVLNACDRLVGVDRYSNWPAGALRGVPVVGGGMDPNIEAIVALRPDVVLMANQPRWAGRLEALGIRTLTLDAENQAQVHRVLRAVGQLLHLPAAQGADRVWQRMREGVQVVKASLPRNVAQQKVYFEVNTGPFAAGPTSFLGELLTDLGLQNIVAPEMGTFPRVAPEYVLRHQPDVILLSHHAQGRSGSFPGWRQLAAVQQQRMCRFSADDSVVLVRPGPRMDASARILAQCLQTVMSGRGAP